MTNVTNKQILIGLVGLGLLNALLCFFVVLRENTNGERIARLSTELAAAREAQQELIRSQKIELKKMIDETRGSTNDKLALARDAREALQKQIKAQQTDLEKMRDESRDSLRKTNDKWETDFKEVQTRLNDLEKKLKPRRPREKPTDAGLPQPR